MEDSYVIFITVLVALTFTLFNILTISIVLFDRHMRKRVSNYAIMGFLVVSAIQGSTAAPLYVYKKLDEDDIGEWICDAARMPYIICGHLMKISLLVISFDRMLAIKYPFHYEKHVTKRNMVILLILLWLITLAIDMIPLATDVSYESKCKYIPTRTWGLCVIIFYNIIPFIFMAVNYSLVWIVAARVAMKDHNRHKSVMRSYYVDNYGKEDGRHRSQSTKSSNVKFALEMKATRTSLTLIAVYVICWGPLGVFYMIDHFCYNCLSQDRLSTTRAFIKLLCFSSSLMAPIVYCWANKSYRNAAKRVISKYCCKEISSFEPHARTNTVLSQTET